MVFHTLSGEKKHKKLETKNLPAFWFQKLPESSVFIACLVVFPILSLVFS